jgi:hypothetical protein
MTTKKVVKKTAEKHEHRAQTADTPRREIDVAYTLAKQDHDGLFEGEKIDFSKPIQKEPMPPVMVADDGVTAILYYRIAKLEDAIKLHRSLCHRTGFRAQDHALHALVPVK